MTTGKADVFTLMERLRIDQWCVVLKCLPDGFPWLAGGDPSEYGGSGEDTPVSFKPWCAEAQDMRRDGHWRRAQFGDGATPEEAMERLASAIDAEAAGRTD
jgi:hypothetical protein